MFIFFDLGNVLLHFDHQIACRQLASAASTPGRPITAEDVRRVIFDSHLELHYEAGQISTEDFHQVFCQEIAPVSLEVFTQAYCDIFWVNASLKPVLGGLMSARRPLGLLSNTNELHWRWVTDDRYGAIPLAFDVVTLSYEVGDVKPGPRIFQRAAEMAGVAPEDVFYVDDMDENVAGARGRLRRRAIYLNRRPGRRPSCSGSDVQLLR